MEGGKVGENMCVFTSPYLDLDTPCRWLRGNHHGHSTVSDGHDEPLEIVRAYEAEGYQYLALSEHDRLLEASRLQPYTSMCIVQAVEVTSCFGQTLMYLGADRALPPKALTPSEIMNQVDAAGGLFVFDHPNWMPWPDYATDELLATLEGLRGIEIYTGVIERLPGEAKATDRWDRLLSKGWHVFGHGTDDQHQASDHFIAWNQVQWSPQEPVTPEAIVQALGEGRFYASTGVTIARVGASQGGRVLTVESDADEIRWITCGARAVKTVRGGSSHLTVDEFRHLLEGMRLLEDSPAQAVYVRAECLGHGNAAAWTQPLWLTDAPPQRS